MNPETENKLNDLRELIECIPDEFGNLKNKASEILDEVHEDVERLEETVGKKEKELSILMDKVEDLEQDVSDLEEEIRDSESVNIELENKVDILNAPENIHDELRNNVCRRLYNNLSLEQLENVEHTVKQGFKNVNREYILELN